MGPMAGVITRDPDGYPCVGGFRLPPGAANRIMASDAAAEAGMQRAAAERADRAGGAEDLAFAARTGRGGVPAPTLQDVLRRQLNMPEPRYQRGAGGVLVDAESGNPVEELDMEPPKSAARMLTAERHPRPVRDVLAVADELHRDLVRAKSRRNYAAAEEAARAKSRARLCRAGTSGAPSRGTSATARRSSRSSARHGSGWTLRTPRTRLPVTRCCGCGRSSGGP